MLEVIIQFLEGRLNALNIFTKLYGLCEIVQDEQNNERRSFPAEYIGAGNYKLYPNDFDLTQNHGYFRIESVSEDREDSEIYGGETVLTRTYSMKFIGYVNKDIYQVDNKYATDKIVHNLSQMLSLEDVKQVRDDLDLLSITSRVTNIETDRYAVLEEEYDNVNLSALDLQYAYVSFDFDIVISATAGCLFAYACGDQTVDVATLLSNAYGNCQVADVSNSDSTYSTTVASGGTLNLPDITLTEVDGSEVTYPSVKDLVCDADLCADGSVSNSDDSYTNTVSSGGSLELPDIEVTEVDGSTTTVPSVQNVTCDSSLCPQFLKGVFASGDTDMEQLTIDTDSAGTYDTETTDGSSGTITYSVNGGAFETLAAKGGSITLADTDTLDVKRTVSSAAGFFKLAN